MYFEELEFLLMKNGLKQQMGKGSTWGQVMMKGKNPSLKA
jgi:hypothetical protein